MGINFQVFSIICFRLKLVIHDYPIIIITVMSFVPNPRFEFLTPQANRYHSY
jgi:hypothetical protein